MPLPEYINCKSQIICHCDYLMHEDCPNTCGYAKDVLGETGCSKLTTSIKIRKGLDKLLKEDMRDY